MRVLIVSYSDLAGGAARGAYRLHECLGATGFDSWMLVQRKVSEDRRVLEYRPCLRRMAPNGYRSLRARVETAPLRWYRNRPPSTVFTTAWLPSNIVKAINRLSPDVVHFHWLGWGMIRLEDFPLIKAPVIWTLHDMWAFTGGCHYDQECGRYVDQCGTCPMLGSHRANDLSRWTWERKKRALSAMPSLTVVGLSRWLAACASRSSLLTGRSVVNLPNPIDTTFFRPVDRVVARQKRGLPANKKLVLFGATDSTGDPRKGFDKLVAALGQINTPDVELVVFGGRGGLEHLPFRSNVLVDFISDEDLVELYAAADVMVVPSLQENLAATIMEPLACGTPVVAFGIGGNVDMITHKHNGYVATPFDVADLARGIRFVLGHASPTTLRTAARAMVVSRYDYSVMGRRYGDLYQQIVASAQDGGFSQGVPPQASESSWVAK